MELHRVLSQTWMRMGLIIAAFVGILVLGQTSVSQAQNFANTNGTIPGQLTEIRGKVTDFESDSFISVCGIPKVLWFDGTSEPLERYGVLADWESTEGVYARVLATYGMDKNLWANRIQVIDEPPFARIRGIVRSMDVPLTTLNVDGMDVEVDADTHIAGKVDVGQRVDIKADMDSCRDDVILATHIVGKAAPKLKKPVMLQGTVTEIVPKNSDVSEWIGTWKIEVANGDTIEFRVESDKDAGKKPVNPDDEPEVKVFALEQDDGSLIAKKIIVMPGKGPK